MITISNTGNTVVLTNTLASSDVYFGMRVVYKSTSDDETVLLALYKTENYNFTLDHDGYYLIQSIMLKDTDEATGTYGYQLVNGEPVVYKNTAEGWVVLEDFDEMFSSTTDTIYENPFVSLLKLNECYIDYAKATLKNCPSDCDSSSTSLTSDRGKRDFIWTTLNVVKYYISFLQYTAAQKLLEKVNNCGGLCNILNTSTNAQGCGCSKSS